MTTDAERLVRLLRAAPLRISNEAALQASIEDMLSRAGEPYEREMRLSAGDRPDFMCGGIAIEAKARYGKRSIYLQLQRYAAHDSVTAIILVTGTAMGMPAAINGKPVYVVSVGMSFL